MFFTVELSTVLTIRCVVRLINKKKKKKKKKNLPEQLEFVGRSIYLFVVHWARDPNLMILVIIKFFFFRRSISLQRELPVS